MIYSYIKQEFLRISHNLYVVRVNAHTEIIQIARNESWLQFFRFAKGQSVKEGRHKIWYVGNRTQSLQQQVIMNSYYH